MASALVIISFLLATLSIAGAQPIGVCYGGDGTNLPPPSEVVALYRQNNIKRMRIYDPNPQILEALRGSDIELMLGVPNRDLENLANNPSAAPAWVQNNVKRYCPAVRIRYIAVGNEANREARYAQNVVRAMTNVYNAVRDAGLLGEIKVSTTIDFGVMGASWPPSAGAFRGEVMDLMNPIIGFLSDTRNPLLVSIYPYFAYAGDSNSMKLSYGHFTNQSAVGNNLKLSYGLFTNPSSEFSDPGNNLQYQNLFDAQVDSMYSALAKASGSRVRIIVTESGWPSRGRSHASINNARTYNQNLIRHVRRGTPMKPGQPTETYLFAMFNENAKYGNEDERNFGLFYPDKRPVYPIDFSS